MLRGVEEEKAGGGKWLCFRVLVEGLGLGLNIWKSLLGFLQLPHPMSTVTLLSRSFLLVVVGIVCVLERERTREREGF